MKLDHTFNDVSFCLGFIIHDSRPRACSYTAALLSCMQSNFLKTYFLQSQMMLLSKKKTLPLNSFIS